ncbi:MAG: hypothetical protein R3B09_00060 [Nannocystaceae bacterium]
MTQEPCRRRHVQKDILVALALASLSPAACLRPGAPSAGSDESASTSGALGMSSTSGASAGSTSSSATVDATTTTTTSTAATSATDGCAFVCPREDLGDDDRDPPFCDPYGHECPEGQKCAPWGDDYGGVQSATCVPVARDPKAPGEPCTLQGDLYSGLDDCVEGALCTDIDGETLQGTCVALCAGPDGYDGCNDDILSCCPPDQLCESNRVFGLCLTPCHPRTDSCPKGEGCYSYGGGDDFRCLPDESGDLGAPGEPCAGPTECDPGVYCGPQGGYVGCDPNPDVAGCCAPFCDLTAPNCAEGAVCAPWYGPMDFVLPFYADLGVCQIPG